ncbi:MAG: hypothetical protein J6Z22_00370 [Lachnospiraceae bacterium]|nr:hypothetical protein [Lachnospiraceae bacterium]
MIKADIIQMGAVLGQLEDSLSRYRNIIHATREVESKMAQTSNLIQLKREVEKAVLTEEVNYRSLKQFVECLGTAMEIYSVREEKILDYAEEVMQAGGGAEELIAQEIPSWFYTLLS